MLLSLRIQNYALIDDLEFQPSGGLNIITGETGSGKSILLDALGLILGERADFSSLRNPEKKCLIEGHFSVETYGLKPFFETHDLDYEETCILRREILPGGKSRAFINDSPAALNLMKKLGSLMVDIHTQHGQEELMEAGFQLRLLDLFGENQRLLGNYLPLYQSWRNLATEIEQLKSRQQSALEERDFKQFRFDELEAAQLQEGEQKKLEDELSILEQAESFRILAEEMHAEINEKEGSLTEKSGAWLKQFRSFGEDQEIQDLMERLSQAVDELLDISRETMTKAEQLDANPSILEEKNQRLNLLYELSRKYRSNHADELIGIRDSLEKDLQEMEFSDEKLKEKESESARMEQELRLIALQLREHRNKSALTLAKKTADLLALLGMPHARMEFKFHALEQPGPSGMDRIELLFSANKGLAMGGIGSIASGGERSRFMLSIKSLMAEHHALPTLIFDEIDTGVSGSVAGAIANLLEKISKDHQLLCITHSPQVASRGTKHFKIEKLHDSDQTYTRLIDLDTSEREKEIAAMLSGAEPGASALAHARQLLSGSA